MALIAAPYTAAQQAFDPNLPSGQRYYSTAPDLAELSVAAIAAPLLPTAVSGALVLIALLTNGIVAARIAGFFAQVSNPDPTQLGNYQTLGMQLLNDALAAEIEEIEPLR